MRSFEIALICFLGIATLRCSAEPLTYDGYQVFKTNELTAEQAKSLSKIQSQSGKFDFWDDPTAGKAASIMSAPNSISDLSNIFNNLGIKSSVSIKDVGRVIRETSRPSSRRLGPNPHYALDWNDYYEYEVIVEFLEELAAMNDFIDVVTIGQTYEGRDVKAIEITKAGPGAPVYFIEAGIHAREWIGPAVVTYLIRELVENIAAHPQYTDSINFHIIPVANPDGYAFTFTGDRLWRKTRSDTGSTVGCLGVDPNRNFGLHWGESGVSADKCANTYPGDAEFSEVETRNIRDYYRSLSPRPIVGHSFHSSAEMWLYPYGYAYDTFAENVVEQVALANASVEALFQVHGIVFPVLVGSDLYLHSGAASDWYASEGSRFAYTTELRNQGFDFLLPPEQIIPSGEEIWAAFQVILNKIIEISKTEM